MDEPTEMLGPAARKMAPADPEAFGERAGDTIGPYRLLDIAGEGGCGTVWLAERREPFVQRVALKVIKAGMDTRAVIARFEQERQALAVMDHPGIAKVLDAGTTSTGRPYFVMEYVAGEPLTDYCDKHRLTITQRLELFIHVCEAVQHAHMKGIIHRDIKPSNLLVAVHGDQPFPKVIDFGVAKAISQAFTAKTVYTEMGQLIGTLEYMSPEQAEMRGADIDTRCDIYSLGAVLYEIVSGSLPFDTDTLRGAGFAQIQKIIREKDPPKPSTKLTNLDAAASSAIAAVRRIERDELVSKLRRELDWILMKALEKNRARRYSTASEFAADIRRYLKNEPVLAGPPTPSYRLKKFVARHKLGVTAAGLVLTALAMGIAGTTVALIRAVRAERLATRQARISDESLRFLVDLFKVVDPSESRAQSVTAREILDKGAARIEADLADQPQAQATLMSTMATAYRGLGSYKTAEDLYDKALTTQRALSSAPSAELAGILNNYAKLLVKMAKFDAAEPLCRQALEMRTTLYGESHPDVAESLNDTAYLLAQKGDFAAAEPMYRRALELRRRLVGPESEPVAETLHWLGLNLFDQGNADAALPLLTEALSIRRKRFGSKPHPDIAESLNSLALVLYTHGEPDKAQPMFREALDIQKRLVGEVHPDVAMAMNNLAFVLHDSGDLDGAETIYNEVLAIQRKLLGENHPDIARAMNNLAAVLSDKGDARGAVRYSRDSLAMYRKVDGEEHPDVAQAMSNLARWLQDTGETTEAESMFRQSLAMSQKLLGDNHPAVAVTQTGLANLLVETGRADEGLKLATQARAGCVAAFTDAHWRTAVADGVIGGALTRLARYQEAEPLLLKSYQAVQKEKGAAMYSKDARRRLVVLYEAWKKPDAAAPYRDSPGPAVGRK